MKGININCKKYPFVEWILNGDKTYETRNCNSLKSVVGKRVALIETGNGKAQVKGYATICGYIKVTNKELWNEYRNDHMVPEGSEYDYVGKTKYLYGLIDVERCEPYDAPNGGRVIRNL